MTPLDQSIIALCDRHNLASASVSAIRFTKGVSFCANVQWLDEAQDGGRDIATGDGETVADALNAAVAEMLVKRGGNVELPDSPLELAA